MGLKDWENFFAVCQLSRLSITKLGEEVGTVTHHHATIINRWHPADGTGTVLGAVGGHRGDDGQTCELDRGLDL